MFSGANVHAGSDELSALRFKPRKALRKAVLCSARRHLSDEEGHRLSPWLECTISFQACASRSQ